MTIGLEMIVVTHWVPDHFIFFSFPPIFYGHYTKIGGVLVK